MTAQLMDAHLSASEPVLVFRADLGTVPLAGTGGERITEGLDGLAERLAVQRRQGARFAFWRIELTAGPSTRAVKANAHALARFAALCQRHDVVPVLEVEVTGADDHSITRVAVITSTVLREVFRQLLIAGVDLSEVVLSPNLVLPGAIGEPSATGQAVAEATLAVLTAQVPATVGRIALRHDRLSAEVGAAHLAAVRTAAAVGPALPWPLTGPLEQAQETPAGT